jgi:hypothetical protein
MMCPIDPWHQFCCSFLRTRPSKRFGITLYNFNQGGTTVTVFGANIAAKGTPYQCQFGSLPPVPATYIDSTKVQCISPQNPANSNSTRTVRVDVLDVGNNSTALFNAGVSFTYIGLCPTSFCSSNGFCSLGKCVCLHGWTGTHLILESPAHGCM